MDALEIKLRLDRSHAESEAAAFHQAEKQRQAEAERGRARAEAEKKRIDNRDLSETEIRERAKAAIYRKTNQQRIDEYVKAHRFEIDLGRESEQRLLSATKALGSFAGQMLGLSSAQAVVGEIAKGFQDVANSILRGSDLAQSLRENLLELAALKDRMGDTSAELVDTLRIQAQTGQKRGDAIKMQENFLGIGEAAVTSGRATMEDVQKAMIGVGRLQAAQGADAGAYGTLGGLLLQTMPKGSKPEDIAKEAAAMYDIAQPGGFSSFGSAIGQYGKAMPYIQSGVLSSREAMALTSAFSIAEPENAATRVDQLVRATIGAMGRDRRVAAPEGVDVQGTATYLQGLGAKGDMSPMDIVRLIGADVKRAQAAGGAEFNAFSYLQHQGFGNVEDLKAILGASGMIDSGTWDKTFAGTIGDKDLGKARLAEANARLASDPGLQRRQATAGAEIANMLPGMGRAEVMRSLDEAARSRLVARNPMAGLMSLEDVQGASIFNPRAWIESSAIAGERSGMLMQFADKYGVGYSPSHGMGGSTYLSDAEQYRVAGELSSRGIDVQGEVNRQLAEAAANLNSAAGLISRPPPLQAAPRQPAAAPR